MSTWQQVRNKILVGIATWTLCPGKARRWLMRASGVQMGIGVQIRPGGAYLCGRLTIGDNVRISEEWSFMDYAQITIGDGARIGPGVRIITITHPMGPHEQRSDDARLALPVVVGAGTWLGGSVTVLPGVTIGEGCVVAAGAVVISDCEPDGLYAGVPAVRKRDLPVESPASHEQEVSVAG